MLWILLGNDSKLFRDNNMVKLVIILLVLLVRYWEVEFRLSIFVNVCIYRLFGSRYFFIVWVILFLLLLFYGWVDVEGFRLLILLGEWYRVKVL